MLLKAIVGVVPQVFHWIIPRVTGDVETHAVDKVRKQ